MQIQQHFPKVNTNYQNKMQTPLSFGSNELTKDELDSILEYKCDSRAVNAYLRYRDRNQKPYEYPTPTELQKVEKIITDLDSACKKSSLSEDKIVYRFLKDTALNENSVFYSDKGFMNTCKRYDHMKAILNWFNADTQIIKIKLPKGYKCIEDEVALKRYDTEGEIIIPRGAVFKVEGITKTEDEFPDKYCRVENIINLVPA